MLYFKELSEDYASPVKECVAFLRENPMETLELGRHYLGDTGIFVNLMEYDTKAYEEGFFEAHRTYADFHVVITGCEQDFYGDVEEMEQEPYQEEGDYLICKPRSTTASVLLTANSGVVFLPQDAHMPCITADTPCHVRKAVFKIPMDLFD
ncbi:MAG: YhcH/YjgK/YiaL family protein [Clostridia bacterium]|nr:YhcH/YjgK/YiaL family protein [Clostridia bacterium]